MVTAFHPPSTQHINGRTGGNIGTEVTFTGDYEVDDVEGCLPFERHQQIELYRHVASLPAACWMPHRTRRRMPTC